VQIKKDAAKILRGLFQGRLTPEGLFLRQGRIHDISLGVGTPAEYLGGNRLEVTLPDRRVELSIGGRVYQRRLARDLAAFLGGRKPFLNASSYLIPLYVYIPAILPLGIPILTLGGALPVMVGFGLAGACIAIAQQERWPIAARILAALGLSFLGYTGLFVLFFIAFRGLPPVHQNKNLAPVVNPNHGNQTVTRNWRALVSRECGFSISMPGAAKETVRRAVNTGRTVHAFQVEEPQDHFSLVCFTPPLPGQQTQLFQELRSVRQDFPLGKIEPERLLALGTYQGWEITIRFADRTLVRRSYSGHGRDFILTVSSSRLPQIVPDALRFFDSFQPADANQPEPAPRRSQLQVQQPRPRLLQGPTSEIIALDFSPDGKLLRAVTQNGELRSWETASEKVTSAVAYPEQPVRLLAFAMSSAGNVAAASALGGEFSFVDAATLRPQTIFIDRLTREIVWSIALSPDGKQVASGHKGGVRLWSLSSKMPPQELPVRNERVNSLTFTPDGKMVAAGTRANTITLWKVGEAREWATFRGRSGTPGTAGAVWTLACAPDGNTLAAAGNDQMVHLWDLPSQRETARLAHTETFRSAIFSPDGKLLATGDDAGNVALWKTGAAWRKAFFLADNLRHSVRALAFSPDSTALAASLGNQVRLWEMSKVRWDDDQK
jgi:WD40 repeat protein